MSNSERDWLDEMIEERIQIEPEFAHEWAKAEQRLHLAQLRRESGKTQTQIAEIMGVTQPRVAEIERHPHRVSFARLQRYMHAIGGTVELKLVREEQTTYEP
ncbi:MAG: helix-turn-helix domain-containing protein [Fimbriimonadaceae bacterium]